MLLMPPICRFNFSISSSSFRPSFLVISRNSPRSLRRSRSMRWGDPIAHGAEVGEGSPKPALVYIKHAASSGFDLDGLLGLFLGADEEEAAPLLRQVPNELISLGEQSQRLLQVDNVDAVALRKNELLHLGVPPARLVSEVYAGLQKQLHAHYFTCPGLGVDDLLLHATFFPSPTACAPRKIDGDIPAEFTIQRDSGATVLNRVQPFRSYLAP